MQTPISAFDRASAIATAEQIAQALQPLAERLGITITQGRTVYGAAQITVKIECAVKSTNGEPSGREAQAFKFNAHLYGLEPGDLGRHFNAQGRMFRVTGLSPRSPKRPILAEGDDGKVYKFTHASVCAALGRPAPQW